MTGDTSEQISFPSDINDPSYTYDMSYFFELFERYRYAVDQLEKELREITQGDTISKRERLTGENSSSLLIQILEESLTAQNLSTIIAAITDLHTRCWLIEQKRFTDLMDYAQTRDPRFVKEANLLVGIMTHNSPALIDFIMSPVGIAGAATIAYVIKKGIDAIVQAPLRYQATKLKNDREALEQKIRKQEAQQEQKKASQKAQLELERQQLEIDRQHLELQKDRIKFTIEVATTLGSQLQPDVDKGTRELLAHSLVPPLLQIATTEGLEALLPLPQTNEKNK